MTINATSKSSVGLSYITGEWSHIFDGDNGERLTRIVLDANSRKLIAMDVQRNRSISTSFSAASRIEVEDVEDSIVNANSEVFDNPDDFGLVSSQQLPDWAVKPAAHEVTFEQFAALAVAVPLTNHGRRWNVTFAGRDSSFSDADTQELALRDAHSAAINNALYFNLPDSPCFGDKPSIPPLEVLAQYPELVERFTELGLTLNPQTQQPNAGTQLSML